MCHFLDLHKAVLVIFMTQKINKRQEKLTNAIIFWLFFFSLYATKGTIFSGTG